MPAIVLDLLKYAFLFILYVFVARAVRAVYLELRPAASRPAARKPAAPARKTKKPPSRIVVIEGETHKGKSFGLGQELRIGRATECDIVLEDTYVSQVHARVFARNGRYLAEDLGSTNGTYVNGRRITAAAEVQRGDRLKIGRTVLELRR